MEQPATDGPGTTSWSFSRDVSVPRIEGGVVYYTLMEIVNLNETGNYWTLRYKVNQNSVPVMVPTTNATPGAPPVATTR